MEGKLPVYKRKEVVYSYLDKIIAKAPVSTTFDVNSIIDYDNRLFQGPEKAWDMLMINVHNEFISQGYAAEQSNKMLLLTDLGREIRNEGGYFAFKTKADKEKFEATERQRQNDEKLKYDVKNAKRIFKTYWWTFAISILAFLIALLNLIYNLFGSVK